MVLSIDKWTAPGFLVIYFAVLVAMPNLLTIREMTSMHPIHGDVVRMYIGSNLRGSVLRLIIVVDYGPGLIRIFTNVGMLNSPESRANLAAGDVIDAEVSDDMFGRNLHRVWSLRRGRQVIFSREELTGNRLADAQRFAIYSAAAFSVGVAMFLLGRYVRDRREQA